MQDSSLDNIVIHEIESVFLALPESARTPEQLVQTITYYIKSHMKYDVISLMQLLPRMENDLKDHCEELVSSMKEK